MAGHEDKPYDVLVVGGGTAGAVVASRLTEDPDRRVCLVEAGPSDQGDDRVLTLRRRTELLGSELDVDYPVVEQARGNSHVRHRGARVLGGCSSHSPLISLRPLPGDLDEWVKAGCGGWDHLSMAPYWVRLLSTIAPVAEKDRNPVARDFVAAAASAMGVPEVDDLNAAPFAGGAGFLPVAYDPESNRRSSASVAYLHPFLSRPNLTVQLETWAYRLQVSGEGRVSGVNVRHEDGTTRLLRADDVIVCAGALDTPRLLMLSGIGPAADLRDLGIDVVSDVPGVGQNLLDHPESVVVWETKEPLPPSSATDSDAALFVCRNGSARGVPATAGATLEPEVGPDLVFGFSQAPFTLRTERLGYPVPEHGVSMTPSVPKPRSVGRMWLTSDDPTVTPALDFRYFTDPDGHDERTIVDGLRIARDVGAASPLAEHLAREVAPGSDVSTDDELSAYGRSVAHTVHHPAGTAAMGSDDNPMAVVDPALRVRGVRGLRVADASVFPTMPAVDPMVTVLMVAERAADLVARGRPAI